MVTRVRLVNHQPDVHRVRLGERLVAPYEAEPASSRQFRLVPRCVEVEVGVGVAVEVGVGEDTSRRSGGQRAAD